MFVAFLMVGRFWVKLTYRSGQGGDGEETDDEAYGQVDEEIDTHCCGVRCSCCKARFLEEGAKEDFPDGWFMVLS